MGKYIRERRRMVILVCVFALVCAVFGASYEGHYRGRFYPGTIIGGMDVGGMAYGDITALFKKRADALVEGGLDLVFENNGQEKDVKVPVFTAGLTSDSLVPYFSLGDWEATIRRAYDFGRAGPPWQRAAEQLSAVLTGNRADLPGSVNASAIQSFFARELKGFFKDAVPAQFAWNGSAIVVAPEKIGDGIDEPDVLAAIRERLASFDGSIIHFSVRREIPAVLADDLRPFLKLANDVARSTRLVFRYQNKQWNVSGRTLAAWLTLKKEGEIGVDAARLKSFLAKTVVPLINDPPRNSRFEMRRGILVEIVPGKSGNVVDIPKTIARVEKIVYMVQRSYVANRNLFLALVSVGSRVNTQAQTGTIEIPIETTTADPTITAQTIADLGITELVGSAKTSFAGSSADRRHNIEVGVAKLNGVLLAPGEEFSAVKGIGTTTEEEGFAKEFVIKDNKSVKELGGGLCQLATTLFRLALNAGLPVTDRQNHRYVVRYYGPGLDATIYGPEPDLRFVNDTGNYLLLQGKVEGDDVSFELYGQRDGRSVWVSEPTLTDELPAPDIKYVLTPDLPITETTCSETPHKGVTADVTYNIYYANGDNKEQKFHSVYQPWGRICLIGTRQ